MEEVQMERKSKDSIPAGGALSSLIKGEVERRKDDTGAIIFDCLVFVVAFLFSRCHIAFGAYPLGVAFVGVLGRGVWISLTGAVIGSVSLGATGVIHAIIQVIVVFLRVLISGGDKSEEGRSLFKESLGLRICSVVIGAFVGAVYEVLLKKFTLLSVLYGLGAVLMSGAFTFLLSGVFNQKISFSEFVMGKRNLFDGLKNEKDKFGSIVFQGSFLVYVLLLSFSLRGFDVLGISPSYIFSSLITIFVARRFGAVRAMTVGFVSSLGISGIYSVAFALLGLGAGALFGINIGYALIVGGALLAFWSVYVGGSLGFLSTFPEFITAALLAIPFLKKLTKAESVSASKEDTNVASDMVATTALGYRNSDKAGTRSLESALSGISDALLSFGDSEGKITKDEYRDLVIDRIRKYCEGCPGYSACKAQTPAPCAENVDMIASKLHRKERLFPDDISISPRYCNHAEELFCDIVSSAANLEKERFRERKMEAYAEECLLFSKLISESRAKSERELSVDSELSERLASVLDSVGMRGGVIRAFGDRKKYFIGAGEDKDGRMITSPELKEGIEKAAGVKLGSAEYYRKGDVALFECPSAPMYRVEFAYAGEPAATSGVSGDTAVSFESEDGHFYSLISDGMGSGELARKTSLFTADFLSRILNSSCTKGTAFHLLNHIIRNRGAECSATVDLFEFDLLSGEAIFFKCGAAPSYVKRGGSLFRVRSETAPIGLMKSIDAERIRVEIKSGDYVVMLSDGVSQTLDDAVWLLEILNKEAKRDVKEYAEYILSEAKKHTKGFDDMSVSVARVFAA